jgi:hypothetical protein
MVRHLALARKKGLALNTHGAAKRSNVFDAQCGQLHHNTYRVIAATTAAKR